MKTWTAMDAIDVRRRVYIEAENATEILEQMAADLREADQHSDECVETYLLHTIRDDAEYPDWYGELITEIYWPPKRDAVA